MSARSRNTGQLAATWGSTPVERAAPFPCDAHLTAPDAALFRALDVAAPAPLVFRWLCQLRAAPYSYDWLDNGGRQSPRRLTPGLDALAPGQRVMTIFRLIDFARDEQLTLVMGKPSTVIFGAVVLTYRVVPRGQERSRIVIKMLLRYPFWGRWQFAQSLFARGDLLMMRKQLRTLSGLAEQAARRSTGTGQRG